MFKLSRLLIMGLPFLLLGCSYFSAPSFIANRDKHYLRAQSIPPMRIPPGLDSEQFENYYPVSDRNYPGNKDVSLIPPTLMSR